MQDYLGNTTARERMGLRAQFNQPFYGSNGIQNYGGVTNTGYVSPEALSALNMDTTLQITPDQLQGMSSGINGGAGASSTDWGMNGMGGVALGAGQLGLGLLGYLDNKKTSGLQRNLLQQQYDTNASELAHTQAARKAVEGGFSNVGSSKLPVYK